MILTLTFDPSSKLGIGSSKYTGMTPTLPANEAICTSEQYAAPARWKLSTDGKTIVAATTAEIVPMLATALMTAAALVTATITAQVVPDQDHQNAYANAAAIVGPGATVPTADPAKTAFASLAAAFKANPQDFATMAVAVASVSMQLLAVRAALNTASGAAKTAADLGNALTTFETGIAGIVSTLGAAGVVVGAPAGISIAGINA